MIIATLSVALLTYIAGGLFTARGCKIWMENRLGEDDPWESRQFGGTMYGSYWTSPMKRKYGNPVEKIVVAGITWPVFIPGAALFLGGVKVKELVGPAAKSGAHLFFENPRHRKARKAVKA